MDVEQSQQIVLDDEIIMDNTAHKTDVIIKDNKKELEEMNSVETNSEKANANQPEQTLNQQQPEQASNQQQPPVKKSRKTAGATGGKK